MTFDLEECKYQWISPVICMYTTNKTSCCIHSVQARVQFDARVAGIQPPTGKITTLALNSVEKCAARSSFGALIFYLRIRPWHQKFYKLNPGHSHLIDTFKLRINIEADDDCVDCESVKLCIRQIFLLMTVMVVALTLCDFVIFAWNVGLNPLEFYSEV